MSGFSYSTGRASLTMHVADGQTYQDAALFVNGHQVKGAGANFQGDSVPADAGSSNTYSGGLWDIKTYDVTSDFASGDHSLSVQLGCNNDCLALVVAALSLPVGSTPSPLIWGDNDCSGAINGADGLPVLMDIAHVTSSAIASGNGCPLIGTALGNLVWGDVNCSGGIPRCRIMEPPPLRFLPRRTARCSPQCSI
jgi:hypothetical protein